MVNARERVREVRRFTTPGGAARVLAEVRGHLALLWSMREQEGNIGSALWRYEVRQRARYQAREVLTALRAARVAGRLHEPFKRSGVR